MQWQTNTRFEIAKSYFLKWLTAWIKSPMLKWLCVSMVTPKIPPQDCDDTRLEVPFGKIQPI